MFGQFDLSKRGAGGRALLESKKKGMLGWIDASKRCAVGSVRCRAHIYPETEIMLDKEYSERNICFVIMSV